jgi:hypothetical protein
VRVDIQSRALVEVGQNGRAGIDRILEQAFAVLIEELA